MKTIVVTSQKGGSGKTTVARNLAVAAQEDAQRVLMIDLDPQDSLRGWWEARETDAPAMLAEDPAPEALAKVLKQAASQFDLVVIDTPPSVGDWQKTVLKAADLILIPVRPSPDDLRAVGRTIDAANTAKRPFAFVLTQTPRARIVDAAARELGQHGRVAPVNVNSRVSYAEAAMTGIGVTESKDTKANDEITHLWNYVKGIL